MPICLVCSVISALDIVARKKWYTIKESVDIDTGELLTESRLQRESWIKVGQEKRIDYSNSTYNINYITNIYEKSRQLDIRFIR